MEQKFNVTGMTCSACSSKVEREVSKMDGINKVTVNLLTNSMQVDFDENITSNSKIIQTVVKAGYDASAVGTKGAENTAEYTPPKRIGENQAEIAAFKKRIAVSFAFLIPLMYVSMGSMMGAPLPKFLTGVENGVSFAFIQFLLCVPVLIVNQKYFIKGFGSLWHKSPNMDSLVATGSAAGLVYGIFAIFRMSYALGQGDMATVHQYHMNLYFESSAMILCLINLGKFLETKSKGKTSEALNKLIDLAPKTALVERNGDIAEIPVEQVAAGDILVVKPGSSIPADGFVIEGETHIDEAAITGESIPVFKEKGSAVIAATINKEGFIKVKATKVGKDTTFSQIIALVENASSTKAPIAKLADKIAGVFVPVVMAIALVTAVVWLSLGAGFEFALNNSISVLVISCPCALGLATPVAIMVGTGKGAENGILIKSGEALEVAHNVQTVVLDKTGTITEGKPKVTDIYAVGTDKNTLLQIAAGLEAKSEHPLAVAVCEYAAKNRINPLETQNFEAVSGKGITAEIAGDKYIAGNMRMMEENNTDISSVKSVADSFAEDGKTPLIFAKNNSVIGVIAVADTLKATSKEAINDLTDMGIDVIMLTGDNEKTAKGIGKDLALSRIIAEVLPQDKEKVISELQAEGKTVAMVGDGINDAPALVRADVGIAIGSGTDVAIESADIILMHNDLYSVVTAVKLSKAVIKNIKQNLFWAFFYNCLGIPLAAGLFYHSFGWQLNPMFGAAAMSCSSLFVVTNALRLKYFQTKNLTDIKANEEITEEKETIIMTTLKVNGMMCPMSKKHVEEALNAFEGVQAEVNLEAKEAKVNHPDTISAQELADAVTKAGYEVVGIE
ncbi:MAG: heavy metal translocating P-type ATPase [Oscillospiraceae bacterium]|nr:heavy metal translocating P-type ATPase [Oscillospiraceae bacterium]